MTSNPLPAPTQLEVVPGPRLLASRQAIRPLSPARSRERLASTLLAECQRVDLRGRGGAAFPFARKLRSVLEQPGRKVVVANFAEGETGSAKDEALGRYAWEDVWEGLRLGYDAIGATDAFVVYGAERPDLGAALRAAARTRSFRKLKVVEAAPGFVSGQARAVVELLSGRENLPVTSWEPESVVGVKGRPTLLSNAETWAQLAHLHRLGSLTYASVGSPDEPGTTLLTLRDSTDPSRAVVREVELGTPWAEVLPSGWASRDVLVGGFHGTWVPGAQLAQERVSRAEMADLGHPLGAGLVYAVDHCPVEETARIVAYLASQSARRCGPCFNGLPALSAALFDLTGGSGGIDEVERFAGLVNGRGACAHPDGTVRLVRSLLRVYADEVAVHATGHCEKGRP